MTWPLFIPAVVAALLLLAIDLAVAMRRTREVRAPALVAIAGIVAFPLAILLHNVLSALLGGEEGVTFVVALLVAPVATMIGTVGVWLAGRGAVRRRVFANGVGLAGLGLAVFAAYMAFAFAVSLAGRTAPPQQADVEPFVLAASALLVVGGTLVATLGLYAAPSRAAA